MVVAKYALRSLPDVGNAPGANREISRAAMKIEKIGVVGAGQMGNGIAHVCALAGYDVVMEDINADALGRARATIERNLRRQATRGLITQSDADAAMKRIRIAGELSAMNDRDLVIEAA